jgi:protein-tyrosine phosphatase
MLSFIYKSILLAYLLLVDKFKTSYKTLAQKVLPTLTPQQPILVRHEGRYFIFLNDWQSILSDFSNLKMAYSFATNGDFKGISFTKKENYLELDIENVSQRIFIQITYLDQKITIGERLLDFKGTVNFRDIGGFLTEDGREVKWGKIFRSGHLYKLGKAEHSVFNSLAIQTVIDFRGHQMLKRFPDRVPNPDKVNFINIPIESKGLEMRKLGRKILKDDLEDFDAKIVLIKAYRDFIDFSQEETKIIFKTLLENKQGILLHCSAGKDRTGFFTALILRVLGVPMTQIERDYLASNYFRKQENDSLLEKAKLFTDPARLYSLINVEIDFLRVAFSYIDEKYGSLNNYLTEILGISEEMQEALRKEYLTPSDS